MIAVASNKVEISSAQGHVLGPPITSALLSSREQARVGEKGWGKG